ncbi:hypothetical protein Tco_1201016 [Tanacetum coccineum]
MDYHHQTEEELGIDLDKPLSKQDPLDKLNDLANKKRKHADDIHDNFRANKRLKSSVQYEDHPARTVLNEPVLGMIMFNSDHWQDIVTIEDFRDFPNEMLRTVQEIFFRLHQGPGIDDHARTFSSFLLAEVDKRNLNPLKQMREMLINCHDHNLSKGNIIKIFYHGLNEITQEVLNAVVGGIFLYKTSNQAYQLLEDKVLLKLDWAKSQKTKSSLKKTIAFAAEGSSISDTDKIMARMGTMTMKMDAQYKDFQSRSKQSNLDDDDIPMSRKEEAKFMQTFCHTHF